VKKDGSKADPLRIVDSNNEPWNGALIGNGSKVDVKFVVKDYGVGKKKGVYIRAVRVLDLVPYVAQDFAPLSTDDEFFATGSQETSSETEDKATEFTTVQDVLDDLDDDVPGLGD
jgi:hypothetical protein